MKKFTDYLADFSFGDLVVLWNEYASENGYSEIYDSIEDFADVFDGSFEGAELARMVFFGDVRNWGGMVYLNGYGNFQSCWNVENSPIDVAQLVQWMKDSNHQDWKNWLDSIEADDFASWLGGILQNEDLAELWGEYVEALDEDDLESNGLPLNFDLEDLAKELMADRHQHFDDFIDRNV